MDESDRAGISRLPIGGIEFSNVSGPSDAIKTIDRNLVANEEMVVVTPNIQHLSLSKDDGEFLFSLNDADLVLADGWPVARLLRLTYEYRGGRVTGSDLSVSLLAHLNNEFPGIGVTFIGGSDESLVGACERVATTRRRRR